MLIRFADLRTGPFHWEETVNVPAASLERDELLTLGPVRWSGRVSWAEPGYYLRARLDYEQTLRCDRCLEPISRPAGADVELLLVAEPEPTGDEIELDEEDLGIVYVDGEVYDTRPLLIEQIQLGIPMKPLCRPDCRGLCPQCGADLNAGDCGCQRETTDPRWAGLAVIRDRLADGD